jgi:tRNA-splicing ligase RtcB
MRPERIDPFRLRLARPAGCACDATIFASERVPIDQASVDQLLNAMEIPDAAVVVATPDIHSGYGVPIGSIIATRGSLLPAAVGYDVNCGMRLLATPLRAEESTVRRVAEGVRRLIPLGEGKRNIEPRAEDFDAVLAHGLAGLAEIDPPDARLAASWDPEEVLRDSVRVEDAGAMPGDPSHVSRQARERGGGQLATLGGGNHFLEFQTVDAIFDTDAAEALGLSRGQLVVMIHSGSRALGHQVGEEFLPRAREHAKSRGLSGALGFLPAGDAAGRAYLGAMNAAANFAFANRELMTLLLRRAVHEALSPEVEVALIYDVPHNIAKRERHGGEDLWVHRKGATRAFPPRRMAQAPFDTIGQPAIIPGSMGTSSYLVLGTDTSAASLNSVNHGAGRAMSRTEASGRSRRGKRREGGAAISDEDFRRAMEGILLLCEDRRRIKEEAPQAYKDIDAVMETVVEAGLGRLLARMKPLAVLKG